MEIPNSPDRRDSHFLVKGHTYHHEHEVNLNMDYDYYWMMVMQMVEMQRWRKWMKLMMNKKMKQATVMVN